MIRDRIKELRRVKASELIPNPRNWRQHPAAQKAALQGVLAEIGFADALLARETPDGLMLLDGHLRAETTADQEVPVLILDVDEAEANKILLTLDPLSAMAETSADHLQSLLREVDTDCSALRQMMTDLATNAGLSPQRESNDSKPVSLPDKYAIVIPCTDELSQRSMLERLTNEGIECRALIV
jgi:hypothetical protein